MRFPVVCHVQIPHFKFLYTELRTMHSTLIEYAPNKIPLKVEALQRHYMFSQSYPYQNKKNTESDAAGQWYDKRRTQTSGIKLEATHSGISQMLKT